LPQAAVELSTWSFGTVPAGRQIGS